MAASDDRESRLDAALEAWLEAARRGEAPEIETYASQHPDLAKDLRVLLPLLGEVEVTKSEVEKSPTLADKPEQIGEYRVLRRIGRGGMGDVFEAERNGERFAIKRMHAHLLERGSSEARFLQEAKLGAQVEHAAVVRTLDAGVEETPMGRIPYLVMEFVEGRNLSVLLSEVGSLPDRLCRHIGLEVARALEAIHAQGIIHRDIKPENVMITDEETIRLADLGVAFVVRQAARLSQTGEFVGSLLHAAPEQLRKSEADARSDLYSLGLLLHEVASGVLPGAGAQLPQSGDAAPSVRAVAPQVSPFLDALIRWLLEVEPEDRPESAAVVASILEGGEESAWWRRKALRQSTDAGEAPTLHGRIRALRELDEHLAACEGRSGRVTLLVGEAGVGKSHLMRAWVHTTSSSRPAVLVRHLPGGEGRSQPPLVSAVALLLGSDAGDIDKLEAYLDGDEGRAIRAGALMGSRSEIPRGFTPEAIGALLIDLLKSLTRSGPVVLVAEDVQHAAHISRGLLHGLAQAAARMPLHLVLTGRPGAFRSGPGGISSLAHAEKVELGPLQPQDAESLLRAELPEHAIGQLPELLRLGAGHPLYLHELARHARERGAAEGAIPESLGDLVQARIASLDASDQELLHAAACLGDPFDPIFLANALGRRELEVLLALGRMEGSGGVIVQRGRAYCFQHPLVREALENELHPALRERLHGAFARMYEEVPVGGALAVEAARPLEVARHHLAAGQPDQAAPHLEAALDHLTARHEIEAAARLAQEALERAPKLDGRLRARALLALSEGHHLERRELTQTKDRLTEARACLDGTPATVLHVEVLAAYGFICRALGELDEAEVAADQAVAYGREVGDDRALAHALRMRSGLRKVFDRIEESEADLAECLTAAGRAGSREVECSALNSLAIRSQNRGEHQRAFALFRSAISIARACGQRSTEATANSNAGWTQAMIGRAATGLSLVERALQIAHETGHQMLIQQALSSRALVLLILGRFDESLQTSDDLLARARRNGHVEDQATALHGLASLSLACMRIGELEGWHTEARRLLGEHEGRHATWLCQNEIVAASLCGDFAAAQAARSRLVEVSRRPHHGGLGFAQEALANSLSYWCQGDFDRIAAECEKTCRDLARVELRHMRNWVFLVAAGASLEREDRDTARALLGAVDPLPEHEPGEYAMRLALLAVAGEGDLLEAALEFERRGASMPGWARLFGLLVLADAGATQVHEALVTVARAFVDGAPEGDRERMLADVDPIRRALRYEEA